MDTYNKANAPNGGWGWVVVGGVALINMTNQAITSVFGLLFGSQLESMNQGTSAAALITNLNCLSLSFSGLFIGPAIKTLGPRNSSAIGCLLVSVGLLLCSIGFEVWHYIVGYSVFVGIGFGLISPSTFFIINSYFTTKRGRAVGVALAGAGIGQTILPQIVRILLDNYGFRKAATALSIYALIGIIGAFLFRPLVSSNNIQPKHNNRKHIKLLLENDDKDCKSKQLEIKIVTHEDLSNDANTRQEIKSKTLCDKLCYRLVESMDLELLKDPIFWSLVVGMGLVYTATANFSMLFPYFLQHSVGLTRTDTATCMSVVAGADIICRLLIPCITDKLKVSYRVVFLLGTVGLLISRAALAESTDYITIIAMSVFTGMTKSATVLNNNLAISEHCRPEKLAGGLGLNMISKGVLVITVGQLLGWFRDYTNSYVLCLHAQNAILFFVLIVWTPEIMYKYCKRQRNIASIEIEETTECARMNTKRNEC